MANYRTPWNSRLIGLQQQILISFIQAISIAPLQAHCYPEALLTQHGYCVQVHTEALQATASKGLAQGLYMAAKIGFEPVTLQTKGDESTNEPPYPINSSIWTNGHVPCF